MTWRRPSEDVDKAPARKALAFAPSVSLMTELHFQLYKTSLWTKTAIVRHGKPHFAPSYPSEPQNSGWPAVVASSSEIERALPHTARRQTNWETYHGLTIPTSRLTATMCESIAHFSKDSARFDSYLLCTFRPADCGCPRADTPRSAPCECGGNCWDALGKGGSNLTSDTVEQNSHSGTCFCNTTRTSVVQSMN